MATPLSIKRMTRERVVLSKPNQDYFVSFPSDSLLNFTAYIFGPSDTLYAYKLIKVNFTIPTTYPINPPICKHIQHSTGRIHPNLYVEGKVCLSILGTWQGEKWAQAMTVDIVLITIRSLLDNAPYKHEPGQSDDPAYNEYVKYHSWTTLLLDHLDKETDKELRCFLDMYLRFKGAEILEELKKQQTNFRGSTTLMTGRYNRHTVTVNFKGLADKLEKHIAEAEKRLTTLEKEDNVLFEDVRKRMGGFAPSTSESQDATPSRGPCESEGQTSKSKGVPSASRAATGSCSKVETGVPSTLSTTSAIPSGLHLYNTQPVNSTPSTTATHPFSYSQPFYNANFNSQPQHFHFPSPFSAIHSTNPINNTTFQQSSSQSTPQHNSLPSSASAFTRTSTMTSTFTGPSPFSGPDSSPSKRKRSVEEIDIMEVNKISKAK